MIRALIQRLLARAGRYFNQSLVDEMRAHRKQLVSRVTESEKRVLTALEQVTTRAEQKVAKQQRVMEDVARDVARLRAEIRLRAARDRQAHGRADGGPRIPLTADVEADLSASATRRRDLAGSEGEQVGLPADSILRLAACPVCDGAASTQVCEYNKLLLLDSGLDEAASVYDYSMCHDCGVVSARRRPVGPRYAWLVERFEVTLGRAQDGMPPSGNAALNSGALTEEDRSALRARVAQGVFVSEHSGLSRRQYLPALLQDRMAASVHIELLGSLLPLKTPRVLELRPRLGSIGAALRRLYGAEVYGMPLFDGQQFLIREAYGIPVDHKLDYDCFAIPYEGQFDLVVANHMFTHAVRPRRFFETVRTRLAPGGHIYLYNEPDESDFLEHGKAMINSLNAFHMQAFDSASITRALAASGFEPVFVTHHGGNLVALARGGVLNGEWPRMPSGERDRRLASYHQARDLAILRLPDRLRGRFAAEWDAIVERSYASGLVDFDERGHLRMVKLHRGEAD